MYSLHTKSQFFSQLWTQIEMWMYLKKLYSDCYLASTINQSYFIPILFLSCSTVVFTSFTIIEQFNSFPLLIFPFSLTPYKNNNNKNKNEEICVEFTCAYVEKKIVFHDFKLIYLHGFNLWNIHISTQTLTPMNDWRRSK